MAMPKPSPQMAPSKNVLGGPLELCCADPKTGFFRDGFCNTAAPDSGSHTICVIATEEFLTFSKATGNDLSTPRPEWNFPGVKPGDGWCVCAERWKHAAENHVAPPVKLAACHERALEVVTLEMLQRHTVQ